MLIYANDSGSHNPFRASGGYKSAGNRKRGSIRVKTPKRATTHQHRPPSKRKAKKGGGGGGGKRKLKKKNLNATNVKFLKKLGFRVKKKR